MMLATATSTGAPFHQGPGGGGFQCYQSTNVYAKVLGQNMYTQVPCAKPQCHILSFLTSVSRKLFPLVVLLFSSPNVSCRERARFHLRAKQVFRRSRKKERKKEWMKDSSKGPYKFVLHPFDAAQQPPSLSKPCGNLVCTINTGRTAYRQKASWSEGAGRLTGEEQRGGLVWEDADPAWPHSPLCSPTTCARETEASLSTPAR